MRANVPPSELPKPGSSPHATSLFRHALARKRSGLAHHSAAPGTSRSERDHHLSPSLTTAPQRHRESTGLAPAERQITAERVDEPAAPRGGRSGSRRGTHLHRTQPQVDHLATHQSIASHHALSHRRFGRASRSVHQLRLPSGHLLQQLPGPALPEVSSQPPRPLAPSASSGTSSHALRAEWPAPIAGGRPSKNRT